MMGLFFVCVCVQLYLFMTHKAPGSRLNLDSSYQNAIDKLWGVK